MSRNIALLTALLLFAACGGAPKEQAAEDKIFPYAYKIDDLDNGLRLVTVNTGFPNVVALYVVVQVGSRNEVESGKSGFAHLFEHVMFRGTEKYPPQKWEAIMQAAGAQTNAYTSDDRTVYHAVFSKEDLPAILELEADRFQNLKYSEEVFRTETRAVLSEYNKNFSSPLRKLDEVLRNEAFQSHTYKHTTMGFVEDVENMPSMYQYSLDFFNHYYRPEYTVVTIVGDVTPEQARPLVEKFWGSWKKGEYKAQIPSEPEQSGAKKVDAKFHAPTLPWVSVSFHGPAYDDTVVDSAALDLIAFQAFSENSALYQKLVLQEQKVDALMPDNEDHTDPYLFSVIARVKDPKDVEYVEKEILATLESLKRNAIPAEELESVKSHLRYQFALGMNSTAAIADTMAHYISLRRTPETINKRYALYQKVTAEDVQNVAKKYFSEGNRTIVTLQHDAAAPASEKSE